MVNDVASIIAIFRIDEVAQIQAQVRGKHLHMLAFYYLYEIHIGIETIPCPMTHNHLIYSTHS